MRKWLPAVMTLGGFALSIAVYGALPDTMTLGLERLLPGSTTSAADTVPKLVGAFLLPTIALLILLLLHEAPVGPLGRAAGRLFPPRDQGGMPQPVEYHKFASSYRLIVAWVVMLPLSMHLAVLSHVLGWSIEPGTIVGVAFGIGLVIVGNVMPRLRQNPVAGIRTARTMSDPILWARVHRWYGALWIIAGVLVVIVAITAPRYALLTGAAGLLLTSVEALIAPRGAPAPSSSRG